MADQPLVSCIMPTADRRAFVPAAIAHFLRQDYPHKELLIVDDGNHTVADLVPADERVRYIRTPARTTVGAKRNLACAQARGELIAHWDDDDWHADHRLSYQVDALLAANAELCGLTRLLFLDTRSGHGWRYVYPDRNGRWLGGSTLCYRRALWARSPFPALNVGEDMRFVAQARTQPLVLPDETFHVGIIHGRNVSPKSCNGSAWQSYPLAQLARLMGADWPRYSPAAPAPAPPPAAPANELPPALQGLPWDGWAISRRLGQALTARLAELRPRRILELGSGTSTAVLAAHAAAHAAELVSLEHDGAFCAQTARLLEGLGLRAAVDLRLAPIAPLSCPDGVARAWYDAAPAGPFDFVFVDGPPMRQGRGAVLFALADRLAPGWELWLKDGYRSHERECVALWRRHLALDATLRSLDPRGVWVLRPAAHVEPAVEPAAAPPAPSTPISVGLAVRQPPSPPLAAAALALTPAEDAPPMVSCIMPTYNRRRFVPQAISYFLRQDYPHKELLIIDDGSDPVADLVPSDPRIRYVRLAGRHSIGAKRNIACQHAAGSLIICWDDDDWYAPERIAYQVAPLLRGEADMTGLTESLLCQLPLALFWSCRTNLHERMFVQGIVSGTLAFRRHLWTGGIHFPDVSLAEDALFHRELARRGARLARLPNQGCFVYIRHDTNSWRFTAGQHIDRSAWRQVGPPTFMPAADLAFYQQVGFAPQRQAS